METHGPLGTIWVGFALGCFYVALIWLNTLLGFVLTPLFIIPATWLQDFVARRRGQIAIRRDGPSAKPAPAGHRQERPHGRDDPEGWHDE